MPCCGGVVVAYVYDIYFFSFLDEFNFFQTALHEFGHALGLHHSEVEGAVMFPFYGGYDPSFWLQADDILGIQALYGTQDDPAEVPTTTRPMATPPPNMPDMCENPRADAVTQHAINGRLEMYVFYRQYCIRMDGGGIRSGYPQLSRNVFPEITQRVKAALYSPGATGEESR